MGRLCAAMTPGIIIEIGGAAVLVRCDDRVFLAAIEDRYVNFLTAAPSVKPIEMELAVAPDGVSAIGLGSVRVSCTEGGWSFERADFRAGWSPNDGRVWVRQLDPSLHSFDSVLRILHSFLVVSRGGFLLHAASGIRNGSAFLFSGVSGAGKTTISRLAPPDAILLTDEISYIVPMEGGYRAFGTPFAGDLGTPGDNASAHLKVAYLLAQGPDNRSDPVSYKEAAASLLRNVLFFAADDPGLVRLVFDTACQFAASVPVRRLTFVPTPRIWEMIV